MVKPGRRARVGATVRVGSATGTVEAILPDGGLRVIRFDEAVDLDAVGRAAVAALHGTPRRGPPTPSVTRRSSRAAPGAIAAPTAGLHFTPEILARVPHAFLTLHVGVGTFKPVKADDLSEHHMHAERFEISPAAADTINARTGRLVAIGTTTVRVLEACARDAAGRLVAQAGETDIFIHPPQTLRHIDALLTNFHLPRSTLLMLVSALAGREFILEAYREAVREEYRFFSYGDCMFITE